MNPGRVSNSGGMCGVAYAAHAAWMAVWVGQYRRNVG